MLILSTGRTGTKFFSEYFRRQKLLSFHEAFRGSSALEYPKISNIHADNEINALEIDREKIEEVVSDYLNNFFNITDSNKLVANFSLGNGVSTLKQKLYYIKKAFHWPMIVSNNHVIDCNNGISLLFEIIFKAAEEKEISTLPVILFRNPIKTIHAIYQIESQSSYYMRPKSFLEKKEGLIAAALIWKNTYNFFLDRTKNDVLKVDLENFQPNDLQPLFNFLGEEIDFEASKVIKRIIKNKPFRSSKVEDIRNSDLYKDKDFSLSESQIDLIIPYISDTASRLGIDIEKSISSYNDFHSRVKTNQGFTP